MRNAKYAGMFYEKAISLLDKQIKDCFEGPKGPGALPAQNIEKKKINAVITPHAGYAYSGQAAAWSYKEIAEQGISDLYIIIGPNHSSAQTGLSTETFEMPYGYVRVDQHFARELVMKGNIKENNKIHEKEHSIEVQIPFLQFVFKKQLEKIKILPILIGQESTREELKKIALDIKEVAMDMNKDITIIISSDFTHYGARYNYIPFGNHRKENIYKMDEKAIDLIKNFKAEKFLDFINEELSTICGALPIYLLLNYLKKGKVDLEQYYTSADLEETSDYKNSVSYASLIFRN
jgi:hypothetical protein